MTTYLTFHGHPAELIELAATIRDPYQGVTRAKRRAGNRLHGGTPGYARIRSTCPEPCCAGRQFARYDSLKVVTEATS
ncbi:hypothetical protein [uncultured Arsenicicoccus sp.]|uniref:hypothetical protein n=1 Tax=uncultured Arsenicicoccus sp. TaxID=491339 RepID=UPI0025988E55|nr:hypothetical protein [uncultured Arsenicicoccus sp.]